MPPIGDTRDVRSLIQEHLDSHKVVIFSKSYCSYCNKVKALFDSLTVGYYALELDVIEKGAEIQATLADMTGQKTVPSVFIGGQHVGGCDSTLKLHAQERLLPMVRGEIDETTYDYDLIVIGGGSGGLAAAKEAAKLGQKVACLDFVQPSPRGTTWGLGGTCVNVGCIPKKLMHQTTLLRRALDDAREFGWEFSDQVSHSWDRMTQAIQDHIGSLNFNYKVQLRSASVTYINAYAEFIAPHKIKCTDRSGVEKVLTSKFFVIATGGRPRYPNVPGAKEFGISSDDLFSLPYCPGRTVSVGASYVSLECAGFLRGLGLDVTVMVRSILLRGFDQQMAELAGDFMKAEGVKFLRPCVPTKVTVCCSFTLSYYISSLHPPINRLFSVSFVNWLCDLGVLLDCATSLWLVYLDRVQSVVNTTARLTASSHKCDHVTLLLHRLPVPECIIYKLCFSSRCGGFHADCLSWCCPTSTCAVACGQHPLPMLSVKHPRWTC